MVSRSDKIEQLFYNRYSSVTEHMEEWVLYDYYYFFSQKYTFFGEKNEVLSNIEIMVKI